jgi:hypothetical protein
MPGLLALKTEIGNFVLAETSFFQSVPSVKPEPVSFVTGREFVFQGSFCFQGKRVKRNMGGFITQSGMNIVKEYFFTLKREAGH